MGKKIRAGAIRKVPLLAIVGDQEQSDQSVTVRRHGVQEQEVLSLEALLGMLESEIGQRLPAHGLKRVR